MSDIDAWRRRQKRYDAIRIAALILLGIVVLVVVGLYLGLASDCYAQRTLVTHLPALPYCLAGHR